MIRVISLGAGVQSTTLALMAEHGLIGPKPDCAIFADTGWEPKAVYEHLERLRKALSYPVYIVNGGNLREDALAGGSTRAQRFAAIPWFLKTTTPAGTVVPIKGDPDADGLFDTGSVTLKEDIVEHGMGRRQCTAHYKLEPIRRKVVELCGGKRRPGQCEMWIGISEDEIQRMKDSRVKYIVNRWPLLEKRITRRQCKEFLASIGWDAPRSACIGCPFHDDNEWRSLEPEEFADAVLVDKAIRHQPKLKGEQFAHRLRIPLDQIDFSAPIDDGQTEFGFLQECEGMCGV